MLEIIISTETYNLIKPRALIYLIFFHFNYLRMIRTCISIVREAKKIMFREKQKKIYDTPLLYAKLIKKK